ncbi:MAG: FliM/FliN family flagellar motor switch protein [Balneolia bacterium]|nr:FliM/FliN family flagellar motor switch protein [Balneolia bacterium]
MSTSNPYSGGRSNVKRIETYNFKQPKLFSKEIMGKLRALHDVLARNVSRVFSNTLRKKVDVSVNRIDQITSRDFLTNVESPSVIYLISVKDITDDIITVLPSGFCIYMIEKQSGGKGGDITEKRTLTTIEEKIISRIAGNVNKEIALAWEPYKDFEIESLIYESKPDNIHLTSIDPAIVVTLGIELDNSQKVEFKISYSYSLLKEAMSSTITKGSSRYKAEKISDEDFASYKRTLSDATVQLRPLLGTTRMSIKQIANLNVGDTISLRQRTDKPLTVKVNGTDKMSAFPGIFRGRRAIKIYEIDEEINEKELL